MRSKNKVHDQFYRDTATAAGAVVTAVSGLTVCRWFGNVGEARIRSTDQFYGDAAQCLPVASQCVGGSGMWKKQE